MSGIEQYGDHPDAAALIRERDAAVAKADLASARLEAAMNVVRTARQCADSTRNAIDYIVDTLSEITSHADKIETHAYMVLSANWNGDKASRTALDSSGDAMPRKMLMCAWPGCGSHATRRFSDGSSQMWMCRFHGPSVEPLQCDCCLENVPRLYRCDDGLLCDICIDSDR